jgi:dihydropteroate synthase
LSERLLFVTGKLAAPALHDTLGRAGLPFDYDVAVMRITVAALMTTEWIAGRLDVPEAATRIMIPGMCEGDVDVLTERFGIPAEKGPADLKALPSWFGRADAREGFGERDIRVFAEINHVPRLDRDEVLALAEYYRDAGADVIDLGLSLGRNWLDEGPRTIAELRAAGFALSIDTLDPDESPEDLDSLDATIAHLEDLGKPYLVDPIIEPIGAGFAASLGRYLEVRRRHPDVEMFMGIGNLTELTEADTPGVTAMLIGFCQELGIRNVLTTEVIHWARGAVQEAVIAAELMHFAVSRGTTPKHIDSRLLTVKDDEFRPYAEDELRELHAQVRDPNYRIFADADWIYVFNADRFVKGTDFNEIFDQLGVEEATHAFYLGKELMKATIARALRKNYRQESPLDWGYMTFAEPKRERVRLTAQETRRAAAEEP